MNYIHLTRPDFPAISSSAMNAPQAFPEKKWQEVTSLRGYLIVCCKWLKQKQTLKLAFEIFKRQIENNDSLIKGCKKRLVFARPLLSLGTPGKHPYRQKRNLFL
jgi:hypothetical protein